MVHRPRATQCAALAAMSLLSCVAPVGPADDGAAGEDVAESAQALTRVVSVNFDDYARGALPAPWSVATASTGSSTRA
jgi:hypothetical protein